MLTVFPQSLGEVVLDNLEKSDPNKVLEINSTDGSKLTVKQARYQTVSIAKNLLTLNLKKNDVVVVFSKPSQKITPIMFACLTIAAPIHLLDTSLENDIISQSILVLKPTLMLYEEELSDTLYKALKSKWPETLRHIISIDSEIIQGTLKLGESLTLPDVGDPKDIFASLLVSSVNSKYSRVERLTHAMLAQEFLNFRQFSAKSKIFFPNHHGFLNQALITMLPVFFNTPRICSPYMDIELSSKKILEIIGTYKITHYFDVSSSFLKIVQAAEQYKLSASLNSLEVVYIVSGVVMQELTEILTKLAPNCKVKKLATYKALKKPVRVLGK